MKRSGIIFRSVIFLALLSLLPACANGRKPMDGPDASQESLTREARVALNSLYDTSP